MKEEKELVEELLDNASIPALSISWCQKGTRHAVSAGVTDTSSLRSVDTNTIFQASSLSKPVSAAIVLDLVAEGKWDLDKPLFEYGEFGPHELRQDPHYRTLTTRMVIGQCSGLPNWFAEGDEKKFMATPNTQFTYSGVALDFLKQLIEKNLHKEWDTIANDFFTKAGMNSSTFKQLPASRLSSTREVARGHEVDGTTVPSVSADSPEVPAASLLTTAQDYISFLQYCYRNNHLKSDLMEGYLSNLPQPTGGAQVQWGLGMGVYSDNNSKIAFHWGNNPGNTSFCAIDTDSGDSIACFSNSVNGPNVFREFTKNIVGDTDKLFQWLSTYCCFSEQKPSLDPEAITNISLEICESAKHHQVSSGVEVTQQYRSAMKEVKDNEEVMEDLKDSKINKFTS